jgi:hypothetical protein
MDKETDQYLTEMALHTATTRELLSNRQKPEREKMVCRAFLRCLGEAFSDDELAVEQDEPVDVLFRNNTRFQIMEILDDGRRRGDEYAALADKINTATSESDLTQPHRPSSPLSLEDTTKLLFEKLAEKSQKYESPPYQPDTKYQLDILVYINRSDHHLYDPTPHVMVTELKQQGWRSVSFIWSHYSVVLYANRDAPNFLRRQVGKILSNWNDLDTLFTP